MFITQAMHIRNNTIRVIRPEPIFGLWRVPQKIFSSEANQKISFDGSKWVTSCMGIQGESLVVNNPFIKGLTFLGGSGIGVPLDSLSSMQMLQMKVTLQASER